MSLRRSLIWTTIGQIVLFASQMGSQIIVSRHLSPYLVGVSAIAFSISDLVNLMQVFGLRNFLIRESEMDTDLVRSAFTVNLIISLFVSLALVLLAFSGQWLYRDLRVGHVLMIIAPLPFILTWELVPGAMMQRSMEFGAIAFVNAAKAAAAAATTIMLVLTSGSYASIAWGSFTGAVFGAFLTNIFGYRHVSLRPGLHRWRDVARFGIHMIGVAGVTNLAFKSVDLIVGRMLGLASLGLYSRATALNNVLWTNVHTVFTRVVFSSMAEERRKTGSIRHIYLRTVNLVTALLWPAFAGLAVFSGPVVRALYGPAWDDAGPLLGIIALSAIGLTAITMTWEVFVVCGETGQQVRYETARAVVTPISTVIGALFGVRGAAFGRIVDALFAVVLYRNPLARLTNTRNSEITCIYVRNAVLTASAITPAVILMSLHHWAPETSLAWVTLGTLLGVVTWGLASVWLNPLISDEVALGWRHVRALLAAILARGTQALPKTREEKDNR